MNRNVELTPAYFPTFGGVGGITMYKIQLTHLASKMIDNWTNINRYPFDPRFQWRK